MTDVYDRAIEEANHFARGRYSRLETPRVRGEWWGFKNGYIIGYHEAQREAQRSEDRAEYERGVQDALVEVARLLGERDE